MRNKDTTFTNSWTKIALNQISKEHLDCFQKNTTYIIRLFAIIHETTRITANSKNVKQLKSMEAY